MRIEPGAVYQRYQAYGAGTQKAEMPVAQPKETAAKTDTISISGAAAREAGIGRLTQNIAAELETSVPAARIQELQQKVAGGEYFVSSDALAGAILGLRG